MRSRLPQLKQTDTLYDVYGRQPRPSHQSAAASLPLRREASQIAASRLQGEGGVPGGEWITVGAIDYEFADQRESLRMKNGYDAAGRTTLFQPTW